MSTRHAELEQVEELLDAPDAESTVDRCVQLLRRSIDRPKFAVYLIDREMAAPRHAATWNVSDAFERASDHPARRSNPVLLAALQRRAVTYNLRLMPLERWLSTTSYQHGAYLGHRVAQVVIAPAIADGRVAATVHIGDGDVDREIAPGELERAERIARALALALREHRRRAAGPASTATGLDVLTPREREVAALVVEELTDIEIGAALCVSPHTVRQHLKSIYRKLRVRSRVGLARRWLGAPDASIRSWSDRSTAPTVGARGEREGVGHGIDLV
jgi:DNA-binding CsgD family transcriptional regulator